MQAVASVSIPHAWIGTAKRNPDSDDWQVKTVLSPIAASLLDNKMCHSQ